jgi:hypothetical protein
MFSNFIPMRLQPQTLSWICLELVEKETIKYDVLEDLRRWRGAACAEMGTPGVKGSLAVPDLVKDSAPTWIS